MLSLQSSASPIMIVVELPSTSRLLCGAQEPFPLLPVSHNGPADPLHAQLPTAVGTAICFAQPWPRLQTSPVSKREALYLQFSFSKEKPFGALKSTKIQPAGNCLQTTWSTACQWYEAWTSKKLHIVSCHGITGFFEENRAQTYLPLSWGFRVPYQKAVRSEFQGA